MVRDWPQSWKCRAVLSAVPPESLARRVGGLPDSPQGAAALQSLTEAGDRNGTRAIVDEVLAPSEVCAFLGSALGDCPFLLDLAVKDISRLAAIVSEPAETRIQTVLAQLAAAEWTSR